MDRVSSTMLLKLDIIFVYIDDEDAKEEILVYDLKLILLSFCLILPADERYMNHIWDLFISSNKFWFAVHLCSHIRWW